MRENGSEAVLANSLQNDFSSTKEVAPPEEPEPEPEPFLKEPKPCQIGHKSALATRYQPVSSTILS